MAHNVPHSNSGFQQLTSFGHIIQLSKSDHIVWPWSLHGSSTTWGSHEERDDIWKKSENMAPNSLAHYFFRHDQHTNLQGRKKYTAGGGGHHNLKGLVQKGQITQEGSRKGHVAHEICQQL